MAQYNINKIQLPNGDICNITAEANISFPISISNGGTNATTAAGARTNLEINTISNATIDNIIATDSNTPSITIPTKTSDLINDSGYITNSTAFNTTQNGTAIGMTSTGTNNNHLFEVSDSYSSFFYGGINSIDLTNSYTISKDTGNAIIDNTIVYLNGNTIIIYLDITCTAATSAGSEVLTGSIQGSFYPLSPYGQIGIAGQNGTSLLTYKVGTDGHFVISCVTGTYGSSNYSDHIQIIYTIT